MARRPSSAIHSRSIRWSGVHPLGLGELLLGEQAGLDPLGQLDLLLGVEQRYLADLLEVVLDRVGGRAGDRHLGGGQVVVIVAEDEGLVVAALAGGLALGRGAHPGAGDRGGRGCFVGLLVVSQLGFRQSVSGASAIPGLRRRASRLVVEVLEVLEVDLAVEVIAFEAASPSGRPPTAHVLGRHRRELLAGLGRPASRACP